MLWAILWLGGLAALGLVGRAILPVEALLQAVVVERLEIVALYDGEIIVVRVLTLRPLLDCLKLNGCLDLRMRTR